MSNKHKHLDYIQDAIKRMSSNSFYLKGWYITIISAMIAFFIDSKNEKIFLVGIPVTIIFWVLDSYYLKQEKMFRKLYEKVTEKDENDIDFKMNHDKFNKDTDCILKIMFTNISIVILYATIIAIQFIIYYNNQY